MEFYSRMDLNSESTCGVSAVLYTTTTRNYSRRHSSLLRRSWILSQGDTVNGEFIAQTLFLNDRQYSHDAEKEAVEQQSSIVWKEGRRSNFWKSFLFWQQETISGDSVYPLSANHKTRCYRWKSVRLEFVRHGLDFHSAIELKFARQGQSFMSKMKFALFFFILCVLASTGKGVLIIRILTMIDVWVCLQI